MKIGIFGGSYNPPHKMHLDIANQLIEKNYLDKIIFVPTGMKYEYKNNLIENEHRYHMIELMIQNYNNYYVSDYELKEDVVYTYQTMDYYKEKYKEDEIYFICGTDNLSYIEKWKRGEYLLENNKFLVISRDSNELKPILENLKDYQKNIIVTDVTPMNISSTDIRKWIQENNIEEAKKYLDEEVLDYILENNLYKEKL